jgi:hypothetical protein
MTVFNIQGDVTEEKLKQKYSSFKAEDDVFNESFLSFIVIITRYEQNCVAIRCQELEEFFNSWATIGVLILPFGGSNFLEGPCAYNETGAFEVWRLYSDTVRAFMESTLSPTTVEDM